MQSFTTLQMPLRLLMGLCHMQYSSMKMAVPTAVSSRVAHVKQMTIPRLEFSAAVLAVRMNNTLQEFQSKVDKTVIWSDSTAVLQYIRGKETNDSTCLWPITWQ